MNDYQWYLYSCGTEGIRPVSARRFAICLQAWLSGHEEYDALDLLSLPHRQRLRLMRRWSRLNRLARLADAGRGTITAGTVTTVPRQPSRENLWLPNDDPPPDAAPGVREPRWPVEPVLSGIGARPIPRPDAAPEPRWHAI